MLEGNKVTSIDARSKELDCVIGLHNLRILCKVDPNYIIPNRRAAIPQDHVFKPLTPMSEVDLKIPPPITLQLEAKMKHIKKFKSLLSSVTPIMKKAVEIGSDETIFFPTVRKRGRNLHDGAYVLQLKLQEEELEVWTVKFLVGASYSYDTHTGYFQLSKDDACIGSICSCYSG